jgi:hypothetical protein
MRHPTESVLRRLIDEPAGVAEADRRHVGDCPVCLVELAAAREDAAVAGAALGSEGSGEVDVAAAWRRLSSALPAAGARRVPARTRRSPGFLRRPAAAALAFGVVLAGAGVAAANDWLPIFRTEQVAPVSVSTADLVALPDLSAYGDIEVTGDGHVQQVADAEAAAGWTGLSAPEVVTLPRGVSGDPIYQVAGEMSAVFTFSADRTAQAAAAAGETLPPPPPGLDGSRVRLVAGPGLAEVWTHASAGVPTLVVARAVAPTAFSSGAPFETVRDYLLSLPGLPAGVAEQLRSFSADGSTLPLPVPVDVATSSDAVVNGLPATVLTAQDGSMAAVVWVDDGVLTAVAGALSADEVLSVARELR